MKKTKRMLPLFITLLLTAAVVCAADFSGNWSGSFKTSDGQTFPWFLTLQQDGDKFSGKIGPQNESDRRAIQDAKVEGSILRFRVPGGDGSGTEFVTVELQLQHEKLVGTMQGKDRTGQIQTYSVSFTRAKAQ